MPSPTLESVYQQARALLRDTQVVGGEDYTDTVLAPYFQEGYRAVYNAMMAGGSKRVQRTIYVNIPFSNTVFIPANQNIFDIFEPILVEERQAGNQVAIVSTSNAIPIVVNAPGHGLNTGGEICVSDVLGTYAPWGVWFVTVIDPNNFSLNGSAGDGSTGTGGYFSVPQNINFTEVLPIDLADQGLDGAITNSLQVYLWQNQQFLFRGSSETQQLRITYWASGTPPTNSNTIINIDNSIDVLAYATAWGAASASGWKELADTLFTRVYGLPAQPGTGLMDCFIAEQVKMKQRGPQRRALPFRSKRSKFGAFLLGG